MRFFLRSVSLFILLFLCLFASLHLFVRLKGREMVTQKIAATFQSGVTIGRISTELPLNLVISDLEVAGWFKVKKVVGGVGLLNLFSDDFILTSLRLEGLQMTLEKKPQPQVSGVTPEADRALQAQEQQKQDNRGGTPVQLQQSFPFPGHIMLKRLIISKASVEFIDYSRQEHPITVTLKNVEATIENIRWPMENSSITFFTLTGRLPFAQGDEEGKVTFEGWINPFRKDMRANLDVRDIDGIALYPYYRDWVALDQDRIASAKLNFSSNITSLNNEVLAACHLELTKIEFKPRQNDEGDHRIEKMVNVVIGLFKAMDQGKVVLDFTFKTKLDNPEFGLLGVIESALKTKVQSVRPNEPPAEQIINFPGKVLKSTVAGTADLTKAIINGTVSVGKELKKAVEVSFTRESNATEAAAENLTVPPINATQ